MRASENLEEVYDWCVAEGNIIPLSDFVEAKIISFLQIAEEDAISAQDAVTKKRWNSAYKLYYDVLHQLVEALLLFDKIKVKNHQCLFAYLCQKHTKLEFNWNFFEKVRTKRNGINYYGTPVDYKDWKEVELQFTLYVNTLKKEITKKLSSLK